MTAKPVSLILPSLDQLGDRAHKLVQEFIRLPLTDRERAADTLAELEVVTAEFRRLRPPPVFSKRRTPIVEQLTLGSDTTLFRNRAPSKIKV